MSKIIPTNNKQDLRFLHHFKECDISTCKYCKSEEGERKKIEQAKFLEQREQERKYALVKAHDSFPKTCDPKTCEHCDNEQRRRYEDEQIAYAAKMTKLYGPNWRENTGSPPGFT